MRRTQARWSALELAVLLLGVLLAGCGGTATSSPTATEKPLPVGTPSPTLVPRPSSWPVYHGAHFTLAYPSGWTSEATPQGNSTPSSPDVVYSFVSPDRTTAVQVNESDGLDVATVQQICASQARDALVMFAGLPMRYSPMVAGGRVRQWTYVTDRGTVYGLAADDYYGTASSSDAIRAQNEAILATFRPDEGFGAPGCG
jgi:hypothetical protein